MIKVLIFNNQKGNSDHWFVNLLAQYLRRVFCLFYRKLRFQKRVTRV